MTSGGKATRQRVFDAAVRLFARRGYDAVGVRDIAAAARANVAAVNYHFGGKAGLLKAVLAEFAGRYWRRIAPPEHGESSRLGRVTAAIRVIIALYREDIELALAAENAVRVRVPEVNAFRISIRSRHRASANQWFARLGIDVGDGPTAAVMRGMLTTLVEAHFRQRYENEVILDTRAELGRADRTRLPELVRKHDDDFYEEYARKLARFYLGGARALQSGRAVPGKGSRR